MDCASKVRTPEQAASRKKLAFSASSCEKCLSGIGPIRCNGHQSSKSNTQGSVTSIGFAINPSAKKRRASLR